MSEPLLIAEGLGAIFRGNDRSFAVFTEQFVLRRGETVLLQAPSGAGKSSLLSLLGAALKPSRAARFEVRTREGEPVDLARAWAEGREGDLVRVRRSAFGYVLQTGALAAFLTVRENIMTPRLFAGGGDVDLDALAGSLGIGDLMNLRPPQLSVGQRQRVAIARALIAEPPILLADEPTASLDMALADEVDRVLAEIVRTRRSCLVMASHRPDSETWRDAPRATVRIERRNDMAVTIFNHGAAA